MALAWEGIYFIPPLFLPATVGTAGELPPIK